MYHEHQNNWKVGFVSSYSVDFYVELDWRGCWSCLSQYISDHSCFQLRKKYCRNSLSAVFWDFRTQKWQRCAKKKRGKELPIFANFHGLIYVQFLFRMQIRIVLPSIVWTPKHIEQHGIFCRPKNEFRHFSKAVKFLYIQ